MIEIRVPFINNNETEAKLVLWTVKDKSLVKKGDIIASFETTKAEIDFECEFDGKIKILGKPGNDYEFGEVIAFIYEDDSDHSYAYGDDHRSYNCNAYLCDYYNCYY